VERAPRFPRDTNPRKRAETAPAPTIREVARAAGVSAMTVSRVLTGRGYVAAETAARVRAAFERLDYRPNPVARLLRGRRSHLIGVTIPSLTSAIHRGVVAGLEDVLGVTEYQLILGHLQAGRQPASSFMELARRQHCDGYVIVPSRADALAEGSGSQPDRPAVVALSSVPGVVADAVLADGREATRAATAQLLTQFGGPVALVGIDSQLSHDLSVLHGYREAVTVAGWEPWVLGVRADEDDGRAGVQAMLTSPQPPRAFIFASTMLVFDGLGEIVQSGRTIGKDIGVVAVVSEERPWTALLPTPIPLLLLPAREIGRRAGRRLLRRFDDPLVAPETEIVPMQLLQPASAAG
jgi:LacI family transcriptional regulator